MSLSCFHAVKRTTTEYNNRPKATVLYVDAVFVGDRSGSMESMGSAPVEGAIEFMTKYKDFGKSNEHKTVVEFISFDNEPTISFSGEAKNIDNQVLNNIRLNMLPRNCTRLYDTAIKSIERQQMRVDNYYKQLSKEVMRLKPSIAVSFTLLTDGVDNMSSKTARDLNRSIKKHKNNYNAVCFFAAANQDAISIGNKYGFSQDTSLQMSSNKEQARNAFRACTNSALRCASQECSSYTQAERDESFNYIDEDDYATDNDYSDYNGGCAQRAYGGNYSQEYQDYDDVDD